MYKITVIIPEHNAHILRAYLTDVYKDVISKYTDYDKQLAMQFTYTNNLPHVADIADFGIFQITITKLTPA